LQIEALISQAGTLDNISNIGIGNSSIPEDSRGKKTCVNRFEILDGCKDFGFSAKLADREQNGRIQAKISQPKS
jgi:hypothetical protein